MFSDKAILRGRFIRREKISGGIWMKKRFWVLCSAMTAVFVGAAGLAALPAKAEETASGVTVAEYVFADGTDPVSYTHLGCSIET